MNLFLLKNDILPTNRVQQHFLHDYQETIVEDLDHRTKLIVHHNVYLILLHSDNRDDHNDYVK